MIPRTQERWQTQDWQQSLAEAFTDVEALLHYLQLPLSLLPAARAASATFPLRVPKGFAALINKGDPGDPLLRQILPLAEELIEEPGFNSDPVGDCHALRNGGLLEKYHDRSLLLTTGACAVHCRYCFRRFFPYGDNNGLRDNWDAAINRLRQSGVSEVILSGGDPLSLSNQRLRSLLERLDTLPQLKRIRFHTRLPIVLPERIESGLLELLRSQRKTIVIVVHCNHAQELGEMSCSALSQLQEAGNLLYNQAVLLRGVNDNASALTKLCESLFSLGVQPYYLHQLDRVRGSAHFEVPLEKAAQLYKQLLAKLPGYMIPRWVKEIPEETSKMPINLIENVKYFV